MLQAHAIHNSSSHEHCTTSPWQAAAASVTSFQGGMTLSLFQTGELDWRVRSCWLQSMSGVAEWLAVVTAYTVTTDTEQDLSRSVNPSQLVGESQSWCLATTTKILRLQITRNREIFPRSIAQSVGRLGEQPIQNHPRSGLRCQNITTGILSPCKPKSLASILLQEHSWCQAPLSGCYGNMARGPPKELSRDRVRICWQATGDDPLCRFSTPSLFWASRRDAGCSETFCNREEEPTLSDGMLCLSESGNKYSWESFFLHSKPFMRCNEQSSGHLEAWF